MQAFGNQLKPGVGNHGLRVLQIVAETVETGFAQCDIAGFGIIEIRRILRETVLGKTISVAEGWYTLDEVVAIMKEEGGLDIVAYQCSDAEYRAGLASKGLPKFFQEDMSQNAKWIAEWGFFGKEKGLVESGHQILSEPLETLSGWVKGGGLDALK